MKKVGGTTDEKEIAKNTAKSKDKSATPEERVSTYEKTLALVAEGLSLVEIAGKRGMTLGTIISHLEKLKAKDSSLNLSPYKPKEKDFKIISDAFKKSGETKISPVHRLLDSRYSYEELRLARLFCNHLDIQCPSGGIFFQFS